MKRSRQKVKVGYTLRLIWFGHTPHTPIALRLVLVILTLQALLWYGDDPGNIKAQQMVGQLVSVSAASYEKNVAPDSIIAAFGTNLATITQVANTLPLPNIISNVTVEVNGRSASLVFISPGQINYLLTADPVEGTKRLLVKRCA